MTYTFTVVSAGGFQWREMTRQDLLTDNRNEQLDPYVQICMRTEEWMCKYRGKNTACNIPDCFSVPTTRRCFRFRVYAGTLACVSLFKQHRNHRLLSTVMLRITAFIPNPTLRTHSRDDRDIIKASQPQRGHRNRKPNATGED